MCLIGFCPNLQTQVFKEQIEQLKEKVRTASPNYFLGTNLYLLFVSFIDNLWEKELKTF